MAKIAIISFTDPWFGEITGGSRAVLKTCQVLCAAGHDVSLYAFHNRNEKVNNSPSISNLHLNSYVTKSNPFLFLSKFPFCVARRYSSAFRKLEWEMFDLVIFEGEQVFRLFSKYKQRCRKTLIRMHDIESNYRLELSKSQSGLLALLNRQEAKKFEKIEKKLSFDQKSTFFFVSNEEMASFSNRFKGPLTHLFFAPPFFDFCLLEPIYPESGILYFGDLSLGNNLKSLSWYIDRVFRRVKEKFPDAQLTICGKISAKDSSALAGICPGVIVKGYVDDLKKEIASCRYVVCPILYGAGIKIKLLESLSFGKLVIANQKAVEGTTFVDKKDLFIAQNEDDYVSLCCEYLPATAQLPDFSANLSFLFKTVYSKEHFLKLIDKVLGH
jgi:glycosyltransferase involved in cell wall biosynthesis